MTDQPTYDVEALRPTYEFTANEPGAVLRPVTDVQPPFVWPCDRRRAHGPHHDGRRLPPRDPTREDSAVSDRPTYELADFAPDGHLHTESPSDCTGECAGHLYALAQDAERTIALVRRAAEEANTGLRPPRLAARILTITEPEAP